VDEQVARVDRPAGEPVVPRVPARRRRAAMAASGLLLVALCGLCATWGRAVLDSDAMWAAVLVTAAVLPAAGTLHARVRHHGVGRLRLDGTVLSGRTPLGAHGVDLARVTAVSVGRDEDTGRLVTVGLSDPGGHVVVPWSQLEALPEAAEVRRLLLDRQQRLALALPRLLCEAWDVPARPDALPHGTPRRRDGFERVVGALTAVGSVAAIAAGALLP
jgi:hypothetical protein